MSAFFRGCMLLAVNLRFGWKAAGGVMLAEAVFRFATCGIFGAWTERLSEWRPLWQANLMTGAAIPAVATLLEFFVLLWKGTPDLRNSMIASIVTTAFTSLLNLHLQRQGLFRAGGRSVWQDLQEMPAALFQRPSAPAWLRADREDGGSPAGPL